MADILCGYTADRDETLAAYLYGEIEPAQRAAFAAHLTTCERCRHELSELRGVRGELQAWTVPPPRSEVRLEALAALRALEIHGDAGAAPAPVPVRHWVVLRDLPSWVQVAAAVLVVGVAAGLANLDVRYDARGLSMRTGWSRPAAVPTNDAGAAGAASTVAVEPEWRADMRAFEARLKTELHAAPSSPAVAQRSDRPADEAEVLQQVRALLRESERKQQNDVALRMAEVAKEFETKRNADLVNVNQSMRAMQSNTGIEVLKQREAISRLDYLVRASGQR